MSFKLCCMTITVSLASASAIVSAPSTDITTWFYACIVNEISVVEYVSEKYHIFDCQ